MELLFTSEEYDNVAADNNPILEETQDLSQLPLEEKERILCILSNSEYCIKQAYKKDLKLIGIILFCLWPVFFAGLFFIMVKMDIAIYLAIVIGMLFVLSFSLYYFIYRWLWNRDILFYHNTQFIYTNQRLMVKGYNPHSRMPNSLYAYNYKNVRDIKVFEKEPFVALSFMVKNYKNLLNEELCLHEEGFSATVPIDKYKDSILEQIKAIQNQ